MARYKQDHIELVTVLHAIQGMNQSEIAIELGENWSQSKVSRVLQVAKEELDLWREERVLKPELAERAQSILAKHEQSSWNYGPLVDWLKGQDPNGHLRDVHIYRANTESAWEEGALQLAQGAAGVIQQRLAKSRQCGIAWGRTLRGLLWQFSKAKFATPWSASENAIEFFPLWGEVPGYKKELDEPFRDYAELASTQLAYDLHHLANRAATNNYTVPNLLASLAIMPVRKFAQKPVKRKTVIELMESNEDYARVFGTDREDNKEVPLVESMDAALIAFGSFDQPGHGFSPAVLNYAEIKKPATMSRFFHGDMGSALVRKEKLKSGRSDDGLTADDIEEAWLGVRTAHLYRCAEDAKNKDQVGILACGVGGGNYGRHKTLLASIRKGLVTEAFIDNGLAASLDEKRKHASKKG